MFPEYIILIIVLLSDVIYNLCSLITILGWIFDTITNKNSLQILANQNPCNEIDQYLVTRSITAYSTEVDVWLNPFLLAGYDTCYNWNSHYGFFICYVNETIELERLNYQFTMICDGIWRNLNMCMSIGQY